jgi:hypothetical protein
VAGVSARFRGWYSFFLGCPSREASAVYLAERKVQLSRNLGHGNKDERQGPTKANRQHQKAGHSPWDLPRANHALVGAPSWGLGGFLGGSGWATGGRKE